MWEIYFVDSGKVVYWTTRKCHNQFGKDEFNEISQGYAPHIVAVKVAKNKKDWILAFPVEAELHGMS